MATKILCGSEIMYTCAPLDTDSYENAICDIHPSVYGFVVEGVYRPAEDTSLKCKKDWSLSVVEPYNIQHWIILNKHPSEIYYPMSDLTNTTYTVLTYDVWRSDAVGPVAVVTETEN